MAFNIAEWGRQYYEDVVDGSGLTDLNLSQLKLKVKKNTIKWVSTAPTTVSTGPTRQVTVRNNNGRADVFGNLQTTKESVMTAKIDITKGVVKGLNKHMRLPLPEEVKSSLGDNIEIDPSKATSEKKDTMTISITSGHDIPEGAAVASVRCKEGEYQGRFSCTVALTGEVVFQEQGNSVAETDISEIVPEEFQVNRGGEVLFEMEGHCEFRWDFEQNIDWQ